MFDYYAYGLRFCSEFELPELSAVGHQADDVDVFVSLGEVTEDDLKGARQISPYIWVRENDFFLEVPGVAQFRVTSGSSILVSPSANIDFDSVRLFLLGSCFGALLMQRGYLVLHGNAIEIGDRCIVCVGPSGVGKSTLSTAFMKRGYRILADDVVPIDGQGDVVPGIPRVKVWDDVVSKLSIKNEGLTLIRPGLSKYNLPLDLSYCDVSRRVSHLFILSGSNIDSVEVDYVHGIEKFSSLSNNTYRHRFVKGMNLENRSSTLAGGIFGSCACATH